MNEELLKGILQAVILVQGIATMLLLRKKRRVGWLIGLSGEGPWLWYAWLLQSWGIAGSAVMWGILNGVNWWSWRKEERSAVHREEQARRSTGHTYTRDGRRIDILVNG